MLNVVCALIENDYRQLLACQRAAGGHLGGFWEFPGGKVELGESPQDALRREIREELAIEVAVGASLKPVEWSDGKVVIRLHPFRCRLESGTPLAHEHEEIRWCGADELRQLAWAPADVPILDEWIGSQG